MSATAKTEFIEIRCVSDRTLLFRARLVESGKFEVEVKCRRCKKTRLVILPRKSRKESAERDESRSAYQQT